MTNGLNTFLLLTGLPLGLLAKAWSSRMILQRQPGLNASLLLNNSWQIQSGWALTGLIINGIVLLTASVSWTALIWLGWFYTLLMLSVVDQVIRKIPNEMLALLIIGKIADLLIHQDASLVPKALIGLAGGYFFFSIPAILGRSIGKGDVKLAAVIGFCIGIIGVLQSVAIMSLGIVMYYSLILKHKRSNLKVKVAMGPYLSLGMMISVLWPITIS